jgi:aspartyl-tRNA(Asn)/glutamyl-tRNA(Gln) amidotransferase subunit A
MMGLMQPSQLLEQTLERIDRLDPELGAYVLVDRDGARAAAAEADRRPGPLAGQLVSIKDNIDMAGMVTGCGSAAAPQIVARRDATVVERLRAAGAVIVGKVRLHEYALGITGENPRRGTPRNPHDHTRLPGGSSSGSAVSVAAGLATASLGTDTGGSVRVPAALCGVVGLKPTHGRISTAGVFPLSWTMDHVGVLARTVADAGLLFSVLHGPDPADPVTVGLPAPLERPGGPWRVALLRGLVDRAAAGVQQAVLDALARLQVQVEPVDSPLPPELPQIYRTILLAEAATVHRRALAAHPELFGSDVRDSLGQGLSLRACDYVEAMRGRAACARAVEELLTRFDCLVTPTALVPAPPIGAREVELEGRSVPVREALLACTSPFSMIGLPALSVPCGLADSLPVGLQIVGPRFAERAVLELGQLVEKASSAPAPGGP